MTDNLIFVLVEPTHPGNIGAAARAMKTMGFSRLALVNPKKFPDANATAMAAGADDLLANAKIYPTLADALSEVQLVVGTSARLRASPITLLSPHQAGSLLINKTQKEGYTCALVFGRESSGLTNPELSLCHYHVRIPSQEAFGSLNLAASVQVLSYECRLAALALTLGAETKQETAKIELATSQQVEHLLARLQNYLAKTHFSQSPQALSQIMLKLHRTSRKARLETAEVAILEGILTTLAGS